MSSLLAMPGEEVANRLVQLAADFVAVLRDPNARLDDLAVATSAAEAKIAEANAASAELDNKRAEVERQLAEANDRALASRQVVERERAQLERDRGALLDEATKLRDQARHDSEMAATKLKELNAKLAAISQAAAA